MGTYGLRLRSEYAEAYWYAPYLVVGGIVLIVLYLVLTGKRARALRVGDLGVGLERDGRTVERQPWHKLKSLGDNGVALRLEFGKHKLWTLPLRQYPLAAKRLVAEARARVPDRVKLDSKVVDKLGKPARNEGERLSPEPPQVTGLRCLSTDKALSFERDVRVCNRCSALYHRSGVPTRCRGCDAVLRKKSK